MTADRPQDVGRSHRRRGQPSEATRALLDEYQQAMRSELRSILEELRGQAAPTGLLDSEFTTSEVLTRPGLKERAALWDLGMKLGRELGSAIDTPAEEPAPSRPARPRRARVDFG